MHMMYLNTAHFIEIVQLIDILIPYFKRFINLRLVTIIFSEVK